MDIGAQARRHTLRRRLRLQPPHGENEEATLATLTSHRELIDSAIDHHHGDPSRKACVLAALFWRNSLNIIPGNFDRGLGKEVP